MSAFDAATLRRLRDADEVAIRTAKRPDRPVVIWIAVDDGEVFVRSARGPRGRWYRDLQADPSATIELDDQRLAVRAVSAADAASIERASREYLRKYRGSPYAQAVVRPDLLSTTLRLEPR
jgi:hypothetical protein